ncbi:hypothetical protein SCHPADRAFT_1001127 [Schizopora paradoxa]|uniref:Bromodomain-containing protein n=1 Tax=Schizopora paradoxa TaxID=27342 RepID=A0A0H2RF58_9AGAM|nr:hypothetical protein SCHPADRAFT_1001127 [Schizopora paradoxa]
MAVTAAQKAAIEEVIDAIKTTTAAPRNKRLLCTMFLELVDRESWPEYYEVIPEPRCLNLIQAKVTKNGYKNVMDVYTDLNLVFKNAMYYNEVGSQISKDAETLQDVMKTEWKKQTVLPAPRVSPPPDASPKKAPTIASSSAKKLEAQPDLPKPPPTVAKVAAAKPVPVSVPPPPTTTSTQNGGGSSDVDIDGGDRSDADVDGDGDGENMAEDMGLTYARDPESDEIVHQLERGLPRWEGLGAKGWSDTLSLDRCLELVLTIKAHKDIISNARFATVLDAIPEEPTNKMLSFNYPLSLKLIETKARSKTYQTPREFELDMARLFEKARRWYEIGSEQYGNILLLQRLYQALLSPNPPTGPPYASQSNFASIPAGPGNAKPLHAASEEGGVAVTTFRVSNKDRHFVDEVHYRGWNIRLADWLHLSNPDDPSRPIIAQVFKCWISEEPARKGRPGVTVCWYYRPEQTFHPSNRQFWENEIFKTGHFADHPLDDIIEKIACQFTARHIRGRPRPPFWYPGWPLYVCDSRYNDRAREFVRIKNWNSCVPEEVRKSSEFMPIYPFERMVWPHRFPSPFLTGKLNKNVKYPGRIDEGADKGNGDQRAEGSRKRSRKPGALGPPTPYRAAGVTRPDDMTRGQYAATGPVAGASASQQAAYSYVQQYAAHAQTQAQIQARRAEDRSIITAAGGMAALGNGAHVEKLPPETARYFDRDPDTNEVLWFSGPPVDIAKPATPHYSLEYLHFLAMKKKAEMLGASDSMDEDSSGVNDQRRKRQRVAAPPLMSELLNELWASTAGSS